MKETMANIVAVGVGRRDITRDMITRLMGADEVARLEEEGRRLDITIENIKGRDARALKWNIYLKQYETYMREAGYPEVFIGGILGIERLAGATVPGGVEKRMQSIRKSFGGEAPVEGSPVIITNNSINYYPRIGSDESGARFTQD